ncbi:MAG: hypothetical protein QW041_03330 [Candidatus Pacearchaeota archaeon]
MFISKSKKDIQYKLKKIKELYYSKNPKTTYEIANILGVTHQAVSYLMKNYGYETRKPYESRLCREKKLPKEEIKKLYVNKKVSVPTLADIYKVSTFKIYRALNKLGIKKRKRGKEKINLPKEEMIYFYKKRNFSTPILSKIYKVSLGTVMNRLKEWNISKRGLEKHLEN